MEKPVVQPWHHLSATDVEAALGADFARGLHPDEAAARLRRYGPNALPAVGGPSVWRMLLGQFHQPLVYVLMAAAGVTLLFKDWVDSSVIFGVVIVNAIIGFLHESKAVRSMEALRRTMSATAVALRQGVWRTLPAEALTPGDVVRLEAGDKAPADLRLFQARNLNAAEAALTGESAPAPKSPEPLEASAPLAERANMVWSGTMIVAGQGAGVVVATGGNTELGRISRLIGEAELLQTPLTKKIARFSHILMVVIACLAMAMFTVGLLRGEPALDTFKASVAMAVGAIPEGLPAAVTVLLAIGMHRMAMRHAVIRKLPAVETLGGVTTICTDKTGTLTQNQMTVRRLWAAGRDYEVTGGGYEVSGEILELPDRQPPAASEALRETLLAGALCNDARIVDRDGRHEAEGDPTEAALLVSAHKWGIERERESKYWERIDSLPFDSAHQYMATLHASEGGHTIYVKGAVERVLERCSAQVDAAGALQPLDREAVLEESRAMAAKGLRVLAFARGKAGAARQLGHEQIAAELQFLGLQAMIDPPRPEAKEAIAACQRAGVAVKMITGDHAVTAAEIARQLGLHGGEKPGEPPRVLESRQLENLTEEELKTVAREAAVFARVTPEQKLRLVKALQANGEVIAMTGDGVNDAPALRQANVGVAMGVTGTEVSREAADIVLTDDNFASIEAAVEEGRNVFDNLTKFIVWTLPTNLGEGLVIFTAVLFGITLPILPTQILWINMTTAVLLGMMLAFEPRDRKVMDRPPRDPNEPILNAALLRRICLVGVLLLGATMILFHWAMYQGANEAAGRTVAVNVFVISAALYLINSRSLEGSFLNAPLFSNPWIWAGITLTVLSQLAFTYIPAMNALFHSAPIGLAEWIAILAAALLVFVAVEIEKWLVARLSSVANPCNRNAETNTSNLTSVGS